MKSNTIVFIDTETGGIDPTVHSLLSIAFAIWEDYKIIATKEVLINDGCLNATPEALKINGIDLIEHSRVALPPQTAIEEIEQFLGIYFEKDTKITLGGHNINFDVNFLKHFISSNSENGFLFHKRFSHRYVDTATILYYLFLAGKIKQKAISSAEAFDLFSINVDKKHTAIGDVIATAKLFTILLKLISKNAKMKSQSSDSLPNLFD